MSTPAAAETTTTQPASLPIGNAPDLETYRDARAKGLTEIPNPQAKPVEAKPDEAPEEDVDPEIQDEVDKLEAPKENETPAEKAARTKRHKEAARKGYATRQKNRADRAETENRDLRRRLEDLERRPAASGDGGDRRASADRPASRAETLADPNDPEPTLESVTAKYPNDPDPYARLQRELAAFDRRQDQRKADAQQRDEQAGKRAADARKRLDAHADHGRGVHKDYDAKLATLGDVLAGTTADEVIGDALADIDDPTVGGELLYQIASRLDELRTTRTRAELLRFIGRLERDITAAAEKPKPHAPVSAAPAPHKPVAAASSASTSFDVTKPSGSIEDYRRHKAGARS